MVPASRQLVDAVVEGEVVAGARGDDHHRDIPASGDARDQGLGSVAAGHPEQVGPLVDGDHIELKLDMGGTTTKASS